MNALPLLRLALPAMGRLLVAWLCWGTLLLGIGLAVLRLLGAWTITGDRLILGFWLGVAGAIAVLQVWHLVLPVGGVAAVVVAALGVAGLVWNAPALGQWGAQRDSLGRLIPLVLLALVAVWLSDRALQGYDLYDSGLYHLQVVHWEQTYAIIPGLANVHTRFGFNNANLLLVALMGGGAWAGRGAPVLHGLLVLGLWAPGLLALVRAFRAGVPRPVDAFTMFLLPAAFLLSVNSVNPELASPSTDLPPAAVTLMSACLLFAYLDEGETPGDAGRRDVRLPALAALLALVVCMKLSGVVFAATAGLIAMVAWACRTPPGGRRQWLTPAAAVLAAAALLVPWMGRGVILSGYPLFPLHVLAAPVPWRVPGALADETRLAIESFARAPGAPIGPSRDWGWLGRVWREFTVARPLEMMDSLIYAEALILAAAVVMVWHGVRRRGGAGRGSRQIPGDGRDGGSAAGWGVLLPWVAAMLCWLLTAPNWRFAWHLFFIPPAVGTAMLLRVCAGTAARGGQAQGRGMRVWRRTLPWLLLLPLVIRVHNLLFFAPLLTPPGIDRGLAPLREAQVAVHETDSGLRVYVPVGTDQCWDAPLPCTPEWRPNLRLREEGRMSSGFVLGPAESAPTQAARAKVHPER